MDKVTSSDGTTIAFDWLGDGTPAIVVGGQLCDRALTRPTAAHRSAFPHNEGPGGRESNGPFVIGGRVLDTYPRRMLTASSR
jgi:hypothetical protein